MSYQSQPQRVASTDKGIFVGHNLVVSLDTVTWHIAETLQITAQGQLISPGGDGEDHIYLSSLQLCFVQVFPRNPGSLAGGSPGGKRILLRKSSSLTSGSSDAGLSVDEPPIIFIKTYDNEKFYVRVPLKLTFVTILSCLLVWQGMKPQGLAKKWYCKNMVPREIRESEDTHEVLVCRFKVYGPIPSKQKNLNIVKGPRAPVYEPKLEIEGTTNDGNTNNGSLINSQSDNVSESWFYSLGVLKSNGILNFVSELDGALLYSIDIKSVMSSEIREVHHSLFHNSNILFVGYIEELRRNNRIKTVNLINYEPKESFLTKDGKPITSKQRVFIEFPLHIDLEDWFVGLNYFSLREYIGAHQVNPSSTKRLETTTIPSSVNHELAPYSDYKKDSLRVSKKVKIDIIEAKFDAEAPEEGQIYAEVLMWGMPWSRTATVPHSKNPFWKEEFATDLPILTQMIHILIKKTTSGLSSLNDKVLGTVYLTPDILTKHLHTTSTMMSGIGSDELSGSGTTLPESGSHNDIVRLPIFDSANVPIGKLLLTVLLREHHILPPKMYKPFENMFINVPMKELIKFCNERVAPSDIENVSLIILDIVQSLGIEDEWFKSLMEVELVNVDNMTRKTYISNKRAGLNGGQKSQNSSASNVFNTLFRGASIFSKALEKYNLRIGQEYLEKVFGEFINKITDEEKDCEIDPRYIKSQIEAERKGRLTDSDRDSDFESDYDSEEEATVDRLIKERVSINFDNLYGYVDEIWHKIHITSNDLPQQIKHQLKNFRTKVELSCDPDDKVTALNCISAFIFLRFFCPAILNPKLFYLSKSHQSGKSQRTLTLVAKILLNLSNRQEFSPHKEPYLVRMNTFLELHQEELLDYFDKITGRRNDFNRKILDLSHEVKRFDLGLSGDASSLELPTTPYLIDKYLRITELVKLLNIHKGRSISHFHKKVNGSEVVESLSSLSIHTFGSSNGRESSPDSRQLVASNGDVHVSDDKNVYQIGSLEFEKAEFLDLAGDNETEGFIKSLCSDENIFSFITSNITIKDLQKQSAKIMKKIGDLEVFLENYEYPTNFSSDQGLWDAFVYDMLSRVYVDTGKKCLVHVDQFSSSTNPDLKKFTDNWLTPLKLKFSASYDNESINIGPRETHSKTQNPLGSLIRPPAKNPFKKWLRKT